MDNKPFTSRFEEERHEERNGYVLTAPFSSQYWVNSSRPHSRQESLARDTFRPVFCFPSLYLAYLVCLSCRDTYMVWRSVSLAVLCEPIGFVDALLALLFFVCILPFLSRDSRVCNYLRYVVTFYVFLSPLFTCFWHTAILLSTSSRHGLWTICLPGQFEFNSCRLAFLLVCFCSSLAFYFFLCGSLFGTRSFRSS